MFLVQMVLSKQARNETNKILNMFTDKKQGNWEDENQNDLKIGKDQL